MNEIKRAVVEFSDGMVIEITKPITVTELCIWLEHYAQGPKPAWPAPDADKVTKG